MPATAVLLAHRWCRLDVTNLYRHPLRTGLPELWAMVDGLNEAVEKQRRIPGMGPDDAWRHATGELESQLRKMRLKLAELERLLADSARRSEQLHQLQQIGTVINSSLELDIVLAAVMDSIVTLLGAERGLLLLVNGEDDRLAVRVARNLNQETVTGPAFDISRTIVRRVYQTGKPIVTTDAGSDVRFNQSESVIHYRLRAVACVPLRVKERTLGVIYADHRTETAGFLDVEVGLLSAFASQAASVIENARLFAQTKEQLMSITEMNYLMDDVFASIPSSLLIIDLRGRLTLHNQAAEKLFLIQKGAKAGTHFRQSLPDVADALAGVMDLVRETGSTQVIEIDVVLEPSLQKRALMVRCSPLRDASQALRGFTVVVDDISEKKRLESVRRYLPPVLVDRARDLDAAQQPQRKTISVLFADVRGFTGLSEGLDPERLIAIINGYFTAATDAITRYGGVIDKFLGDGIMALFNTPLNPQDDHVARAVLAAQAITASVAEHHRTLPAVHRLHFGIGLHTGEAVIGNLGSPQRKDYSAIGDVVNLAKRIQEGACAGQILITEPVLQVLGHEADVEYLPPVPVKGRREVPALYSLKSYRSSL
jgi:PAS domain S-box-containing protein